MKNKLSKLLATFMLCMAFITSLSLTVYADEPIMKLIPSPDGNILEIHNETAGNLYDILVASSKYQYKHIKISGNMNDKDFGCLSLMSSNCKSIDLHEVKANRIPSYEFCCKYNLEEFICPPDIKTIERNCFVQCENLQKFDLPEGLESIENYVFYFCEKLQLNIPETIKVGQNVLVHRQDLLVSTESDLDDFMEESESCSSEQTESTKRSCIFHIVSLFERLRFKTVNSF